MMREFHQPDGQMPFMTMKPEHPKEREEYAKVFGDHTGPLPGHRVSITWVNENVGWKIQQVPVGVEEPVSAGADGLDEQTDDDLLTLAGIHQLHAITKDTSRPEMLARLRAQGIKPI